jgi:predicted phage terminase large subunit-like protein
MRIKRALQPRHWSALYQQNPVPDEGLYFKKEMMRYWPGSFDWREMPVFIAGDLAIAEGEENDYTVFAAGCLDFEDRLHVLEVIRGKWDTDAIVTALLAMVGKYTDGKHVPKVGLEVGIIDKAIKPELMKRRNAKRMFFPMDTELKPIRDKSVRARPLQGRMQQGMVWFPNNQPWVDMVVQELLRFPGGLFDDIVDALAWLAIMSMKAQAPRRPSEKYKKKLELSTQDRLRDYMAKQKQGSGGKTCMAA